MLTYRKPVCVNLCGLAIELLAENISLNAFAPGAINIERSTLSVPVLPVA